MIDKKKILLFYFLCSFIFIYAEDNYSTNFKTLTINKKENEQAIIEKEFLGNFTGKSIFGLGKLENGISSSEYYYKIGEDNICLGISANTKLADETLLFINTQKECGAKCRVYLGKPEEKQIFYAWEPSKEIITNNEKVKIEIITNKKKYVIFVKKDIKELEVTSDGFSKFKAIKGTENLPNLMSLKLWGFNY